MACRRCVEQNRHGRIDRKRLDIPFVARADRMRRSTLISGEAFDCRNYLVGRTLEPVSIAL